MDVKFEIIICILMYIDFLAFALFGYWIGLCQNKIDRTENDR